MKPEHRRAYDKRVLRLMTEDYCRGHHHGTPLCPSCSALLEYAETRIDRCPLGVKKSSCQRCSIHCYAAAPREQIRQVMRYAGPRLLLRHPIIALRHLLWNHLLRS
ncbi:MAG: nitrous oxide-stimulated promoter family protein [Alistipes sp.]|nr:nitrous oxide-stimulated promoter family protein [Alistipes sp.]